MSNKKEVVEVVESDEQIVDRLVHLISDKSKAAIAARNRYVIGLSGTLYLILPVPVLTALIDNGNIFISGD